MPLFVNTILELMRGIRMIRVLFVCLGNICRSPMAEAVFQYKVRAAGLEELIAADSAGTGHWNLGKPPHPGTCRILTANGIAYDHRARLIMRPDLDAFDYIVTMDDRNYSDVRELGSGRAKVLRFMDCAPHTGVREVPDPYYTGNYHEVYRLVNAAADGLIAALRQAHGL
jgi:protein-tyrosine phosphatase